MKSYFNTGLITSILLLVPFQSRSQGTGSSVYWRLDPTVESCSMVIDPSLTQEQWKRFTRQAGEIVTFKTMSSARTIGRNHFSISLDYSSTPIDQHDLAWINTFVHPDADCPLGDEIIMPTLRGKYGINDRVEAGLLWTMAPDANYGLVGAEFKYNFLDEQKNFPAAAVRGSFVSLTGVDDFNVNLGSIDLLASKKVKWVTPYIGVKETFVNAEETTDKVALDNENLFLTQGFIGISYSIWYINMAVEYNISDVNTLSFLLGIQSFRTK